VQNGNGNFNIHWVLGENNGVYSIYSYLCTSF